jgi:hypothetical protein
LIGNLILSKAVHSFPLGPLRVCMEENSLSAEILTTHDILNRNIIVNIEKSQFMNDHALRHNLGITLKHTPRAIQQ